MAKKVYPYEPDYVVPPGWLLEEYLEVRGWSVGEFAGRCGRSPELIAGIIAGETAVDAAMAGELERTLGLAAHIWLGMERGYREGLAQGKGVAAVGRERAG